MGSYGYHYIHGHRGTTNRLICGRTIIDLDRVVIFLNKNEITKLFSHCVFCTCRTYMLKRRVKICFYLYIPTFHNCLKMLLKPYNFLYSKVTSLVFYWYCCHCMSLSCLTNMKANSEINFLWATFILNLAMPGRLRAMP